jgi:hypothetical protein
MTKSKMRPWVQALRIKVPRPKVGEEHSDQKQEPRGSGLCSQALLQKCADVFMCIQFLPQGPLLKCRL